MKHAMLLLMGLLLLGCAKLQIVPETHSGAPTDLPEATACSVVLLVSAEPTGDLPTPVPTPISTPAPTATPAPTENPYRAEAVTTHRQNESFWYGKLTEACKSRIIGSTFPVDPKDCPIGIDDLRYVSILHVDFDGAEHAGELIVHRKVADDVLEIFYRLYEARYPLTSVKLLDDFNEPFSDGLSMEQNNTSAFCCRYVTGTHRFSRHSYGAAIDINPMYNPYIRPDGSFAPENSAPYLDRTLHLPGMIYEDDLCCKLFLAHGWKWGGHFTGETDYQHFYKVLK